MDERRATTRRPPPSAMQHLIYHAGLDTESERRIRLAARTLGAHGVETLVAPWEGVRCALAVVSADDAYGRHVADIARRRALPLLLLGDDGSTVAANESRLEAGASLSTIARVMLRLIRKDAPHESDAAEPSATRPLPAPPGAVPAVDSSVPAHPLVRLATELRGVDVDVRIGSRELHVLRDRGRIVCSSFSDLVEARDRMWLTDTRLTRLRPGASNDALMEVSASLDGFLLAAAAREAPRLPWFPEQPLRLRDWPDLGSESCPPELIQLVALLTKVGRAPSDAARVLGIDPRLTAAFYWALDAAGLFERAASLATPQPSAGKSNGLLARLAVRFGLGRG